jgi:hypothetical protein
VGSHSRSFSCVYSAAGHKNDRLSARVCVYGHACGCLTNAEETRKGPDTQYSPDNHPNRHKVRGDSAAAVEGGEPVVQRAG